MPNGRKIEVICDQCGNTVLKESNHVNRARKDGAKLFCNQKCFGLSRRNNKTDAQKKAEKAEYDCKYRASNASELQRKKKAYYEKNKDKVKKKHAAYRKKNMQRHVEYCRQPEYKKKKAVYDRMYRAKKNFGEFWESALILNELEQEYDSREAFKQNQFYNKNAQKRKRQWKS